LEQPVGTRYGKLIVLLDGASVSGKSTIKNRLLADPAFDFHYVPRYTTRAQRPDDAASPDYIFMSPSDFRQRALAGELLEWRHFLFGMSYGLGWPEIRRGMASGKNLLAVMNPGSVIEVKQQLPESLCVLVDAPLDQIERRIHGRRFPSEGHGLDGPGDAVPKQWTAVRKDSAARRKGGR
jgi:guanylate kinase